MADFFSSLLVISVIESNLWPIVKRKNSGNLKFYYFTSAAAFMLQRAASLDFSYQIPLYDFYLASHVDL